MTQSFDEWRNAQRKELKGYTERDAYEAGAQSKQAEIDEYKEVAESMEDAYLREKAKVDELQRKYDAMYNAFVVADDCRKEWHRCYVGIRQSEDELQKRIDDALKAMEAESENSWGLWKEKADMYEQGASNAYEKSYWILKGTTNEQ